MLDANAVDDPAHDASLAHRAVARRLDTHRRHAEAEVARILDAGRALLPAGGADRTPRVSDIVQRAGVSNDAFYRAFRSKDDLVAALTEQGTRRLLGYVAQQRAKAVNPEGQIRACVRATLFQATPVGSGDAVRSVRYPATPSPPTAGDAPAASMPFLDGIAGLLLDPIAAYGSSDPARDSRAAAALCVATLRDFLWTDRSPSERDVEHLVAFVLRAAGPPGSPPAQARPEPGREAGKQSRHETSTELKGTKSKKHKRAR